MVCKIEKVGFSCKIDRKFAQTDAVALSLGMAKTLSLSKTYTGFWWFWLVGIDRVDGGWDFDGWVDDGSWLDDGGYVGWWWRAGYWSGWWWLGLEYFIE